VADVAGILKVGEASATIRDTATRQRGSTAGYSLVLAVLCIVGAFVGAQMLPANERLAGALIGAGVGLFLYSVFCRRVTIWWFKRKFAQRGQPIDLPLRMEITPDALLYHVGDVDQSARWNAITELFPSHGYWIFLVQSSPWFAPQRFFSNTGAEREFVKAALAQMSEDAKSRSAAAATFASSS